MNMINTIPTKNGQVYYGPTTYAQADRMIQDGAPADEVADTMERHGMPRIAARIRKDYDVR